MIIKIKAIYVVIALLVAVAAVLSANGCQKSEVPPSQAAEITVVDDLGREVTIPKNPERIISISGGATETLYAIGCGDKIVGVDEDSDYPPEVEDKPKVGTGFNLNIEMVLGLDPDFVICWWYHTEAIEKLEEVGIPTIAINPQSIDDVLIMIKFLGTITGHSSEADAIIAEMNGKIDAVKTKVEGIPLEERPLIYYELKTPMKTTGPGTFTDELIRTAGGINLAADRPERYPILNSEYIIQKNPDIIIVVDYGTSPDEIKARGGWDTIKAVKDDHVYSIDTHWVTSNPRIVKGLEQFAHYF